MHIYSKGHEASMNNEAAGAFRKAEGGERESVCGQRGDSHEMILGDTEGANRENFELCVEILPNWFAVESETVTAT